MVIFFGSHHSYDIPAPFLFPKCKCTLLIDQLRIPRQVCVGQHMICDAGCHGRSLLLRRFLGYLMLENILSFSAISAEIAFNFDWTCIDSPAPRPIGKLVIRYVELSTKRAWCSFFDALPFRFCYRKYSWNWTESLLLFILILGL